MKDELSGGQFWLLYSLPTSILTQGHPKDVFVEMNVCMTKCDKIWLLGLRPFLLRLAPLPFSAASQGSEGKSATLPWHTGAAASVLSVFSVCYLLLSCLLGIPGLRCSCSVTGGQQSVMGLWCLEQESGRCSSATGRMGLCGISSTALFRSQHTHPLMLCAGQHLSTKSKCSWTSITS